MLNPTNIWGERQNHPELVVRDAAQAFKLDEEQQRELRLILMRRGVNKWLLARRQFIRLKHDVKTMLKAETPKTRPHRLLQRINERMQHIAKAPRWVEWGTVIHRKMADNENDVTIRGQST